MSRRRFSLGRLPLAAGLFWALVAGFLPYPTLAWFWGVNIRFVVSSLLDNPSWELAAAVVAGCIGTLLALPFRRRRRHLVALPLWLVTGCLALLIGQMAGLLAQLWFNALRYNQPFAFDVHAFVGGLGSPNAVLFVALFGLFPIALVGLVSYPTFARFRSRLFQLGSA